jgi:RNA polymerase sigma factor (sigma-70 family)
MVHRDVDTLFQLGVVAGTSDGQLLDRFTRQQPGASEAAFEEIVRRHGPMVLGVCHRELRDRHAAEDAFQATFLVLTLRAHTVRKQESLGPWLHGVAARVARRARILDRRRREALVPAEVIPGHGPTDPERTEILSILDAEVDRLPEKYRRPVVLCYLEGKTQDEAASALGWTKGTVSGRLARAKDLLRSRLVRRGVAPTAALLGTGLVSEAGAAVVPLSLLRSTVRASAAASLAGMETSLVSGQAAVLARSIISAMFLGRIRAVAPLLLLGLGAAAVAAPFLHAARPAALPMATKERDPALRQSRLYVALGFTPDGKSAFSAESDGLVRFWDPATGRATGSFSLFETAEGVTKVLRDLVISPDGTRLAGVGSIHKPSGSRERAEVWIWSVDRGELLRRIAVDTPDLECLAFSPEGASVATGDHSGRIQLWAVETGEELLALKLGNGVIRWLAFGPDGMTLAASDETSGLQLWDLGGGRPLGALDGSPPDVLSPCFSRDGRLLAFATRGGEVIIWDRLARRRLATTRVDRQDSVAIAFAPDGQSLAVLGSRDGALSVIVSATGQNRWTMRLGQGPDTGGLAYAPDGKTIVVGRGEVLKFVDAALGTVSDVPVDRSDRVLDVRSLVPGVTR